MKVKNQEEVDAGPEEEACPSPVPAEEQAVINRYEVKRVNI